MDTFQCFCIEKHYILRGTHIFLEKKNSKFTTWWNRLLWEKHLHVMVGLGQLVYMWMCKHFTIIATKAYSYSSPVKDLCVWATLSRSYGCYTAPVCVALSPQSPTQNISKYYELFLVTVQLYSQNVVYFFVNFTMALTLFCTMALRSSVGGSSGREDLHTQQTYVQSVTSFGEWNPKRRLASHVW